MSSRLLSVLLFLYTLIRTNAEISNVSHHDCSRYSNGFTTTVVSCVGVGLTEVPSNLPNNITELNLNNNSLSRIQKGDLLGLRNLTIATLRLSQNNIKFIEDASLSSGMTGLVYLFLQHNMLDTIPKDVFSIPSLKYLNLEDNPLQNLTVPLWNNGSRSRLRTLILKNTRLSLLEGDIFANMSLKTLDLSFNSLGSLPNLLFGNSNKKLETLILGINRLTSIPSCTQKLLVLKYLDLSYNKIQTVGTNSLSGLPNLKVLYLSGNGIISIADNAFFHLRLTRLNLSANNLTTIPSSLSSMSSLKMLSLGSNLLGRIQPDTFQSMSELHTLELQNVGLSYLPSGIFSNSALTHLSLAFNKLQGLPMDIFTGTALKVLELQGNHFSQFPRAAAALSTLERLDIRHNNIAVLESVDDFSRLTNLRSLLMHDIGLRRIERDGVFHGMERLEDLDLSGNELATLPKDTFRELPSLKTVLLGQNRIQSVPIDMFSNISTLEYVDLSDNDLEYLSPHSLTLTPDELTSSSPKVELDNNPWYCDENLCPLMAWYSTVQTRASTTVPKCAKPFNMTFHQHAMSTLCVQGTDPSTLTLIYIIMACVFLLVLLFIIAGVAVYRWKKKRQAKSSHVFRPYFSPDIRRQYREDLQTLLSQPDSSEPVYETINDVRCPSSLSNHTYATADHDDDLDTRSVARTGTYLSFPGCNRFTDELSSSDEEDTKSIASHNTYLSLIRDADSIASQHEYLTLHSRDDSAIDSCMNSSETDIVLPGQPVYSSPRWKGYLTRQKSTVSSVTCASYATVSNVIVEDLESEDSCQ